MKLILRSTLYVVVLTVLLGGVYPAARHGRRPALLDGQRPTDLSSGRRPGRRVGAHRPGFAEPEYLHPRPSAAGKNGYDATASSGTNKGPTDADLAKAVAAAVAAARADRPGDPVPCPRTS